MAATELEKLERRKEQLENRIRAVKARERERARKLDTRRKIIIGGAVMAHAERDPDFAFGIQKLLDRIVTRPTDRAAFDGFELFPLEPLDEPDADDTP